MATAIIWFRQDLRIHDNPALNHAVSSGLPVMALYILDDVTSKQWSLGSASRWWLHHSLEKLSLDLSTLNIPLILRSGKSKIIIEELLQQQEIKLFSWNRCYEPFAIERDKEIKNLLQKHEIDVQSFNGSLLQEPWQVLNQQQNFFKVFTPFWKACLKQFQLSPLIAKPKKQALINNELIKKFHSEHLDDWKLLPTKPNWAQKFHTIWQPGEQGAHKQLKSFLKNNINQYADLRDRPDLNATSSLSPHLHFGELSPKQIWHAVLQGVLEQEINTKQSEMFLRQLGWREFSYHLLYHIPTLATENLRKNFDLFPWQHDEKLLKVWQKGQTGYPIIDAGMRQLWQVGYMHNRVRMIVASFLTKDLLIHWSIGEEWFWDTLVDADLANNAASWQWVAGTGADAAPYFRIFNPILQGKKFDPNGDYVKYWIPELKHVDVKFIHEPWLLPEALQVKNYPKPIISHEFARDRALQSYDKVKNLNIEE